MNEKDRLMFYALKWIIERDKFNSELKKSMDEDICNKIVDLLNPEQQRIKSCDMFEKIETIKVPTEFSLTRKDGTKIVIKAKKIVSKKDALQEVGER